MKGTNSCSLHVPAEVLRKHWLPRQAHIPVVEAVRWHHAIVRVGNSDRVRHVNGLGGRCLCVHVDIAFVHAWPCAPCGSSDAKGHLAWWPWHKGPLHTTVLSHACCPVLNCPAIWQSCLQSVAELSQHRMGQSRTDNVSAEIEQARTGAGSLTAGAGEGVDRTGGGARGWGGLGADSICPSCSSQGGSDWGQLGHPERNKPSPHAN